MRTALVCLLLASCQTTQNLVDREAPTHAVGEPVTFGGFEFLAEKASIADSYRWNKGQAEVKSDTGFVFVEVSAKNLSSKPVPLALQPVYRLVDLEGHEYETSLQHSIQFNWPKQVPVEGMNPEVVRKWTLVFEVPPKQYRLQIITPSVATAGFMNESVEVRGKFFYYDLPLNRGE